MNDNEKVAKLAELIKTLGDDLARLEEAGKGIPSVVKNAVRMKGALRQLEVQFVDLNEVKG